MHIIDGSGLNYRYSTFLNKLFLGLSWFSGLLLGVIASMQRADSTVPLMRSVLVERSSIVSLFAVLTFPFLLSALLVWISKPLLLVPVAFLKAFIFGFTAFTVSSAFGDAGWLSRWLLLFSDSCCVAVLLWFWFRNVTGKRRTFKTDVAISLVVTVLVGCIDYYAVSPLSVMLFKLID